MKTFLHILLYLHTGFPVDSTVWEGFRGAALMEKVFHWEQDFRSKTHHPICCLCLVLAIKDVNFQLLVPQIMLSSPLWAPHLWNKPIKTIKTKRTKTNKTPSLLYVVLAIAFYHNRSNKDRSGYQRVGCCCEEPVHVGF